MRKGVTAMTIKRGEIYWIRGTRTEGSEQGGAKWRPGLVIQNDVGNDRSPTVIVAMMTDGEKRWVHTHVAINPIGRLTKPSTILLEQIRTVDKTRISHKIAELPEKIMREVDQKLMISLGLITMEVKTNA